MTDAEKLEVLKQYVLDMAPVYRAALLVDPITKAKHDGWDDAMWETQRELLHILEDT